MPRRNPAALLAATLDGCGTDLSFGVPGGGPNLDLVGAMSATGIRFVLAHGETAACIMASVYGHLTGRLSVAVVTRGPGAAAATNGAAQATLDRHPLLLVTDTVPTSNRLRIPHQRIDQRAMLAPVSKATATMTADAEPAQLAELLNHARAAPAGTIHLDYDASSSGGLRVEPPLTGHSSARSTTASDEALVAPPGDRSSARAMVAAAARPVIVVGLGANQSTRLAESLQAFGAPVLTTYQAIGAIASEDPLSAGLFTNGASERSLLDRADLIITIGLDMVEPIPAPWGYDAPVLSLAATPTKDPYLPIAAEVVGDLDPLVVELLTGPPGQDGTAGHHWPTGAGAEHRERVRTALRSNPEARSATSSARLGPLELVDGVAAAVPPSITITVDAGAHFLAVMPLWPVAKPKQLLISNGLATMGYAVPAAIGAALARPGEPVLCFVGDGGLGMTLAELETIARLELPITIVVFNDSALSLIRIKQQADHGGAEAVAYRPSDFASAAESMGLDGTCVSTSGELALALDGGWDKGRLIDAKIDPGHYRHLIKVTRG